MRTSIVTFLLLFTVTLLTGCADDTEPAPAETDPVIGGGSLDDEGVINDPADPLDPTTDTDNTVDNQNPGTDDPAPTPGCTAAGEVCITLQMPQTLAGQPTNLVVSMYKSLPPMGPPDIMGTEIAAPAVTAGGLLDLKLEGIVETGPYYVLAMLYMPGGGTWMPVPGMPDGNPRCLVMSGSLAIPFSSSGVVAPYSKPSKSDAA